MESRRTILVTGCSDHGLGSALAIALYNSGWRVFASARDMSKLTAVRGVGIECVEMDVVSEESIALAVQEVSRLTGGSLDAIINNAGTGYSMPVVHLDIEKMHQLFDLNVFSIIRVTSRFLPLLLSSQQKPMVVNNTAGSALLGCGVTFQGGYNASKAAAASLTESLRLELSPFGIRVINLITGAVESNFHANTRNNTAHHVLPPSSIYNIAKTEVEGSLAGNQPRPNCTTTETWAKQVAQDIGQKKPPFMIFRGAMSNLARFAALLPIGTMDGTMKRLSGLDILEKRIKEKEISVNNV